MTTTYKKLASYFLERNQSSGTGYGYGYGVEDEDASKLPEDFNSVRADLGITADVNNQILSLATQPDGKIIIGGTFTTVDGTNRNRIARLNLDGTLDAGFNSSVGGSGDSVRAIAIQPDKKIIIGGIFTTIDGTTRNGIARLNLDGTLDAGFNPDTSGVDSIALQSDGKIIIGGSFTAVGGTARTGIARLNSDGTLDAAFNPTITFTFGTAFVFSLAVQPDGKIIIGGIFTTIDGTNRNFVARLKPNGTLDTGFNPNANEMVLSLAVQPDGKIIVGGRFNAIGGINRNLLARLNSDGSLDTEFNVPILGGIVKSVNQIKIQDDGKILISGDFNTVAGEPRANLARINTDGTIDNNFNILVNEKCLAVDIQPDGKIIIGGWFTAVGGVTRNKIARLEEIVDGAPYKLIYTAPANTEVIIGKIFATNHNEFPVFYDIAVVPYPDIFSGVSEKHHYVWDSLVEPNGYDSVSGKVTLSEGDEIYVYSSTDEDISFNIFGAEISE
jgi:uncharacterized delta-60 repeat protein